MPTNCSLCYYLKEWIISPRKQTMTLLVIVGSRQWLLTVPLFSVKTLSRKQTWLLEKSGNWYRETCNHKFSFTTCMFCILWKLLNIRILYKLHVHVYTFMKITKGFTDTYIHTDTNVNETRPCCTILTLIFIASTFLTMKDVAQDRF